MAGVHDLNDGSKVFAGQRDDGFFGDIGAAFDLVAIRSGTGATGGGKDFFAGYAVHTISLQVPLSQLDNGGNHVVGVWSATERPVVKVKLAKWTRPQVPAEDDGVAAGLAARQPAHQRAAHPDQLKDKWNASTPDKDKQFEQYYSSPILAKLLNQLYPQFGPFQETNRTDLVSVLLTGLKEPNLNFTGDTRADEIRLNLGDRADGARRARQPPRRARRRPRGLAQRPAARGRRDRHRGARCRRRPDRTQPAAR